MVHVEEVIALIQCLTVQDLFGEIGLADLVDHAGHVVLADLAAHAVQVGLVDLIHVALHRHSWDVRKDNCVICIRGLYIYSFLYLILRNNSFQLKIVTKNLEKVHLHVK